MGQLVSDEVGEGGGGEVTGCASIIWTGTWSEPVEGRGMSHVWHKGSNEGESKERSRTAGRPEPRRGKRVYTAGWLRRPKPNSEDREKYANDVASSSEDWKRRGSGKGWSMSKCPTARVG